MIVDFEFEVNQALCNAFHAALENYINGSYKADDKAYLQARIDDVTSAPPEKWSAETKRELSVFILQRAGFQSACGWRCGDFEA